MLNLRRRQACTIHLDKRQYALSTSDLIRNLLRGYIETRLTKLISKPITVSWWFVNLSDVPICRRVRMIKIRLFLVFSSARSCPAHVTHTNRRWDFAVRDVTISAPEKRRQSIRLFSPVLRIKLAGLLTPLARCRTRSLVCVESVLLSSPSSQVRHLSHVVHRLLCIQPDNRTDFRSADTIVACAGLCEIIGEAQHGARFFLGSRFGDGGDDTQDVEQPL